mmetsp:Transcript_18845/g.71805  ORF Transcript_18845/g.71805 Transcript_18845/m.71805 type:complete len:265 (+) Transcript_18845:892-1686(+)
MAAAMASDAASHCSASGCGLGGPAAIRTFMGNELKGRTVISRSSSRNTGRRLGWPCAHADAAAHARATMATTSSAAKTNASIGIHRRSLSNASLAAARDWKPVLLPHRGSDSTRGSSVRFGTLPASVGGEVGCRRSQVKPSASFHRSTAAPRGQSHAAAAAGVSPSGNASRTRRVQRSAHFCQATYGAAIKQSTAAATTIQVMRIMALASSPIAQSLSSIVSPRVDRCARTLAITAAPSARNGKGGSRGLAAAAQCGFRVMCTP